VLLVAVRAMKTSDSANRGISLRAPERRREEKHIAQGRPPVVLVGPAGALHSLGQRAIRWMRGPPLTMSMPGVEGQVVGGTGGQPVARIEPLAGRKPQNTHWAP